MKKVSQITSFLLVVMIVLTLATNVLAATGTDVKPEQITGESSVDVSGVTSFGNSIVRVLSTIGVVISVIVLIVLGIKYMLGSAEEKAEYKKTLLPYVIGAALIFAASTIATMVYTFMQNV